MTTWTEQAAVAAYVVEDYVLQDYMIFEWDHSSAAAVPTWSTVTTASTIWT